MIAKPKTNHLSGEFNKATDKIKSVLRNKEKKMPIFLEQNHHRKKLARRNNKVIISLIFKKDQLSGHSNRI